MNILFRTDASKQIGTGHVMRCLTLAHELRRMGVHVIFVCRSLPGNLSGMIREAGFEVHMLPCRAVDEYGPSKRFHHEHWVVGGWEHDARETLTVAAAYETIDWVVVDHYGLDARWEAFVRRSASRIFVIDDLADRMHDCDSLLDQSFAVYPEQRYRALVPDRCRLLLGPSYALLREEFVRVGHRLRDGSIRRILIFYGGVDGTDETSKALRAFTQAGGAEDVHIDVVVGRNHPRLQQVKRQCVNIPNATFHCQVTNMAERMYDADLAFGAGGASTWERCFVGLPTITTVVAENQLNMTEALDDEGAIWNLGWHRGVTESRLCSALNYALSHAREVQAVSAKARSIMGAEPGTRVVCNQLLGDGNASE